MSKRIVLKSFSARSFDVIVRQAPVRAMQRPQPTAKRRLALTPAGDLPVEARSPVDSAKADRTETAGHFPNRTDETAAAVFLLLLFAIFINNFAARSC